MLLAVRHSESEVVGTIGGVVGDNDRDYIYEVVDTDGGVHGLLVGREGYVATSINKCYHRSAHKV
jgi:hypothetical protein